MEGGEAAGEILTLLKSEQTSDSAESSPAKQAITEVVNRNPIVKNTLWIGVMAGIVVLVTYGLWFDKKPAELVDDKQGTVASQPLFQRNPGKTTATPEIKEDQSATPSIVVQSNPEFDSEIVLEPEQELEQSRSRSVVENKS